MYCGTAIAVLPRYALTQYYYSYLVQHSNPHRVSLSYGVTSGSVTSVYRVSYHSSKLYNLEYFEYMFVFECCLFLGRLNCRFRTGVFVVKPRWKTSDYFTRNYLDSNTPLFYSLKQRKKAGFRTQSHITHHRQRRQD